MYLPILLFLLQDSDTPLHAAARAGNSKIIDLLLSKGAQIDTKNIVRYLSSFYTYITTCLHMYIHICIFVLWLPYVRSTTITNEK